MRIVRVWIVLANGINIINFEMKYHTREVFGNVKYEVEIINRNRNIQEIMDIGLVSQFISVLEVKMNHKYEYFVMDDLLFRKYRERIHHIQEKLMIDYSVIAVGQRDMSIDFWNEFRAITSFCKVLSFDFYDMYSQELEILTRAGRLDNFKAFQETCKEIILKMDNLEQECELRDSRKKEMKIEQSAIFDLF